MKKPSARLKLEAGEKPRNTFVLVVDSAGKNFKEVFKTVKESLKEVTKNIVKSVRSTLGGGVLILQLEVNRWVKAYKIAIGKA